jgi:hypothetical protein
MGRRGRGRGRVEERGKSCIGTRSQIVDTPLGVSAIFCRLM